MKHFILTLILLLLTSNSYSQKYGCTDPLSINYDSTATINDGSCLYKDASVTPFINWIIPKELTETSGLIFWNNKLWTHVDDTDINIYSIDTSDVDNIDAYPLKGTYNKDWEEISQDSNYLYIGDFGNNGNGIRKDLKILRIEKASFSTKNPKIDTINFSYSLQTDFTSKGSNKTDFDCESFIVSKDSIFLFTKEWLSNKSSIYSLPKIPGTYSANFISSYDVKGLITGATYIEDKRLVVLCGYSSYLQPFLILLYDFNGHNYFSGNKRKISINEPFHQIEGIASIDGLKYYVSNEMYSNSLITIDQKLHKLDLTEFLNNYLNPKILSIQEKLNDNIKVYPNPTNEKLIIESDGSIIGEDFQIADVNGKTQIKGKINSQLEQINLNIIPTGNYLIIIKNPNFFVKKISKN